MNKPPIKSNPRRISLAQQNEKIVKAVVSAGRNSNKEFSGTRTVTDGAARKIANRSIRENSNKPYSVRLHFALKDLSEYSALLQQNKVIGNCLSNADLLPIAHPRSTRDHYLTGAELSEYRSRWILDDPKITDYGVRTLLASALTSHPATTEYEYAITRLQFMPQGTVPKYALVAALGDGNSSAARRARAMLQRRDRKGRFAEMGGGLKALIRSARGMVRSLTGRTLVQGINTDTFDMELPDGSIVRVPASSAEALKAILPSQVTPDGYSKGPASVSAADPVIDEADLVFVDAPDGFSRDDSFEPDENDLDYYGTKIDHGTMYTDDAYEVLAFDRPNAKAKDLFEVMQQQEAEGQDVVTVGKGKKNWLDPNLPVYFVSRRDGKNKEFAAVQSWADALDFIRQDEPKYEKGERVSPKKKKKGGGTKQPSDTPDIPEGDTPEGDTPEGFDFKDLSDIGKMNRRNWENPDNWQWVESDGYPAVYGGYFEYIGPKWNDEGEESQPLGPPSSIKRELMRKVPAKDKEKAKNSWWRDGYNPSGKPGANLPTADDFPGAKPSPTEPDGGPEQPDFPVTIDPGPIETPPFEAPRDDDGGGDEPDLPITIDPGPIETPPFEVPEAEAEPEAAKPKRDLELLDDPTKLGDRESAFDKAVNHLKENDKRVISPQAGKEILERVGMTDVELKRELEKAGFTWDQYGSKPDSYDFPEDFWTQEALDLGGERVYNNGRKQVRDVKVGEYFVTEDGRLAQVTEKVRITKDKVDPKGKNHRIIGKFVNPDGSLQEDSKPRVDGMPPRFGRDGKVEVWSPNNPSDTSESEAKAEIPDAAPTADITPAPEGYYEFDTEAEYIPEGRKASWLSEEQDVSADYTDDPAELAQRFSSDELRDALQEGVEGFPEDPGTGFGSLPFEDGDEGVPVEAIYKALDEKGEDVATMLDDIHRGEVDTTAVPEVSDEVLEEALDGDLEEPALPVDEPREMLPIIEGLTDEEQAEFLETGDYKPYLLENDGYDEIPEGYHQLETEPYNPDEWEVDPDAPEGWSTDPADLARDFDQDDLIAQLRAAIEPGNEQPGYGLFGMETEEGEEFYTYVPGEAIRDALQLQGVDTNDLIFEIYTEGDQGQEGDVSLFDSKVSDLIDRALQSDNIKENPLEREEIENDIAVIVSGPDGTGVITNMDDDGIDILYTHDGDGNKLDSPETETVSWQDITEDFQEVSFTQDEKEDFYGELEDLVQGQSDDGLTPEEIEDALEGEGETPDTAPEGEPETPSEPEESEPAEGQVEAPEVQPTASEFNVGEPEGPARLRANTTDLKPGDVTVGDNFTIESVEPSDIPGKSWVTGYYPGHQTQKTKLWKNDTSIDVYRNVTPPEKGDLPELSKPFAKDYGKVKPSPDGYEYGPFQPVDPIDRAQYELDWDDYRSALETAKGLWEAPEGLEDWQTEDNAPIYTPTNSIGVTQATPDKLQPGDIAFKKEYGQDYYEYFVIESVSFDSDGRPVVTGYYPGHESQTKNWLPTTKITVMRGADAPPPGDKPALDRPDKNDPDIESLKAAFNEAKKASAATFDPPIDLDEASFRVAPKRPTPPSFKGEKLKQLAAEANGDPKKLLELIDKEGVYHLDFESTGGFASPSPIQVSITKVQDGKVVETITLFMNPEQPLDDFYTKKDPSEVLKDSDGNPISDKFLEMQMSQEDAFKRIFEFMGENPIVSAHNMPFDGGILNAYAEKFGMDYTPGGEIDTLSLARKVMGGAKGHTLAEVAKRFGLAGDDTDWHDASVDVAVLPGILEGLLNEMAKTGKGLDQLDLDKAQEEFNKLNDIYQEMKGQKNKADGELIMVQAFNKGMAGEDVPTVEELVAQLDVDKPTTDELGPATTPSPNEVSDGDFETMSPLGDVVSNNWVSDDENTADIGPVSVEDMEVGDFIDAKLGGYHEIVDIVEDPEDPKRMKLTTRLLANGKEYVKSWVRYQSYKVRRRNGDPQPDAADDLEEKNVGKWNGYSISVDADGVHYAENISAADVAALRSGELNPPNLPFFAPLNGGTPDKDSGDGYYFDSNGKRHWGRFGASGALVRRRNSDGQYEYLLAKRSSALSSGGGKWSFPGGAHKSRADSLEPGKTARDEFMEEVGGDLTSATELATHSANLSPDWSYDTHIFEVGPDQLNNLSIKDGENTEIGWFTAQQIEDMASAGSLIDEFSDAVPGILTFGDDDTVGPKKPTPEVGGADPGQLTQAFDTSDWIPSGGQKGSNEGGFFTDPKTGDQYYVKKPKSDMHAANESLASALYEETGINFGYVYLGKDKKGNTVLVSPLVPNSTADFGTKRSDPDIKKKAQEGFVVDAWLNNWDSVGLAYDNMVTTPDGEVYRIDPGASLIFRAQGADKKESLTPDVSQIDSLRDPSINPQAANIFGDMTDEQLVEGAKKVQAITPEKIDELVDAAFGDVDPETAEFIKERLKARREDIIQRFNLGDEPEVETPAEPAEVVSVDQVAMLDPDGDISAQLLDALVNNQKIAFKYNGKDRIGRVVTDEEGKPVIVENANTGNTNMQVLGDDGVIRWFTISKMEKNSDDFELDVWEGLPEPEITTPEVVPNVDAPEADAPEADAPEADAPETDLNAAVDKTAAKLHDAWRANRLLEDGTYEPRMKDDGQGGEVDIANTPYEDLPEKWKTENKMSAVSAVQAITENPDATDEELASMVHDAWMQRNSSWAPPEQMVPYADLPEEEKQKDRDVVTAAKQTLGIESSPEATTPEPAAPSAREQLNNLLADAARAKLEGENSEKLIGLNNAISESDNNLVVLSHKGETVILEVDEYGKKGSGSAALYLDPDGEPYFFGKDPLDPDGEYKAYRLVDVSTAPDDATPGTSDADSSPEIPDTLLSEPDVDPQPAEKPTEVDPEVKQKLLDSVSSLVESLVGNADDKEKIKEVLESLRQSFDNEDLIDSILADLDAPEVDAPVTPEEKIAADITQNLTPDPEATIDQPEALLEEDIEKGLSNPDETDPELIWQAVKDDYNGTVLDNGHIVVHSVMHGDDQYDVVVRRTGTNSFSIYHRITNGFDGSTKVHVLKGKYHSAAALKNGITKQRWNADSKPAWLKKKGKNETDETLLPTSMGSIPTTKEAHVAPDGTILQKGMTIKIVNPSHKKFGQKAVIVQKKKLFTSGKYKYTDYLRVTYEDGETNNIRSLSVIPEDSDWEWGSPPVPPKAPSSEPWNPFDDPNMPGGDSTPGTDSGGGSGWDIPDDGTPEVDSGWGSDSTPTSEMVSNSVGKNTPDYYNTVLEGEGSEPGAHERFKKYMKKFMVKDGGTTGSAKNMLPGAIVSDGKGSSAVLGRIISPDLVEIHYFGGGKAGTSEQIDPKKISSQELWVDPDVASKALNKFVDTTPFEEGRAAFKKDKEEKEAEQKAKEAIAKAKGGPVNGTGVPAAETGETPDLSYSPIESAPSLEAAIQLLNSSDPRTAAMGTVVVEDAGTVEGLSMRVTRVSVNGEPKIRLQFKVTDWAGNDWMKSLQKRIDSGETGLEVTTTGMEVRKWEILPDGSVVLHPDGTHPHSGTSNGELITIDASRKGQTYQGEIPGGGIFNFHRANKTGNTPDYFKSGNDSNPNVSFHNRVELELPADATAADIQDALDSLNVPDAVFRPATEQDIKTYKENRMIAMLGGKKDPSKNLSGEMREATLNQIKDKWGVTADDVEFISNPADGGRIQMLLPREVGEKIAEATGVKRFEHYWKLGKYSDSMTDSEKAAEIVRLLTDPNFSMLSTTERWTNGINVAGQSSYMDIGAVGGDYLFSTPKTSEFNPAQSPDYGEVFRISLDAAEVLRRMDWYANKHDSFGQLQEEQDYIDYLAGYLAGGGSVYEVLFKHSIHIPSYIIGAEVGTAYKAEVLQRLKDAGITEIHGIPLNDFFKGGA